MRVVLTVNFSPWSAYSGGGQRSTHELAGALTNRGHDVTVVYTKPRFEHVQVPALPYRHVWAEFVGLRSRSGAPLRALNAVTVARAAFRLVDAGATIVHSQGEEGALIPRRKRQQHFGFVLTPRYPSYPDNLARSGPSRYLVPPKYLALGPALSGADRFCPTSQSALDNVCRAYQLDRSRARVVPNGVSPVFLELDRLPDAANGPIVFFGRLAPAKGAHTLLAALARLEDAPPAIVVGRGPAQAQLETLARELNVDARLVGWKSQPQLAELLATASMAVLPSQEESFGNAMVEAMAAGVPLVSTTAGSVPEVVDARSGILVAPNDPEALASAMQTLRVDTEAAEAMGRAGRVRVRDRYSWDATARAYEQVYAEL